MKKLLVSLVLAASFFAGAAQAQALGVVQTLSINEAPGWAYVTFVDGSNFCPAGAVGWFAMTDPAYRDFRSDAVLSKLMAAPITYTVTNQGTWCRVTSWKLTLN